MELNVVILAAGKGKRMASRIPKMLHKIGGISLLEHVINTARSLNPDAIHVVYGNNSEGNIVREKLSYLSVNWIEQKEQLGTAHALLQSISFYKDKDRVLVLYGDVPLISAEILQTLLSDTPTHALGIVTAMFSNPTGLGRVVRDEAGNIIKIVEHKDASEQELKINEINTGIMTVSATHLKKWLPLLKNDNNQKEYYLTDIISIAVSAGHLVKGIIAPHPVEVQGVNDCWQLTQLERYYQQTRAKKLSLTGVTIMDPNRLDIRGSDVELSCDVVVDINVIFEGPIFLARNVYIGPNVFLKNVSVGENTQILANSIIEDAVIGSDCIVGPFARVRPGSVLEKGAKLGNFVEIKKSTLGEGSKANHLTYLGNAVIGKNVNIGAGTITCNYDGANKWETRIEDGAFIGSNVALVAPLSVGKDSTIGAGSTITEDTPSDSLAVSRERQKIVKRWKRPAKKE